MMKCAVQVALIAAVGLLTFLSPVRAQYGESDFHAFDSYHFMPVPPVSGGIGLRLRNVFGYHSVTFLVQARGGLQETGFQIRYMNRRYRFNWGAFAGHVPLSVSKAFVDTGEDSIAGEMIPRVNRIVKHKYFDQIGVMGRYPVGTTHRFELHAGVIRYGFDYELNQVFIQGDQIRREEKDLDEREPETVYLGKATAAFIGDYATAGFTSPLKGARYRIQVSPQVGVSNAFVTVLAEYREYVFLDPLSLAFRGLHVGNYGAEPEDAFATEYLGVTYYPGFVRGYSTGSFSSEECTGPQNCTHINQLQGTRIAAASVELRIPLFGTDDLGLIAFPYLPTEIAPFIDAGVAWTAEEAPIFEFSRAPRMRTPVVSAGVAARFNVLGQMIVEMYYAYPFQRPENGWEFGIRLMPGW